MTWKLAYLLLVAFLLDPISAGSPAAVRSPAVVGDERAAGEPKPDQPSSDTSVDPRAHWAFRPLNKPSPPPAVDSRWIRTPIDAFILKELQKRGWQPAPPASRTELVRRIYFDLTGLPPTPEQIEPILNDPSPEAVERLVDRLLDSPQYGERWAQHWLDVVRYAETEGYEYDRHLPDAWRFRDYVIESLNSDKPFDRFVMEQIAGDELDPNDPECLSAAIFHRLGPVRRNAGNPEIAFSRNEVLTERVDIVGTAFLGLTISCARCHDHKLEPISQKDYYRLQAYLAATEEHNVVLVPQEDQQVWQAEVDRIKGEMDKLQKRAKDAMGEEKTRIEQQIELLEDKMPAPLPTIPSTHNDFSKRTPIHVLRRGVWEQKAESVGPRPPSVLIPHTFDELAPDIQNPRSQLAAWIVAQPLTARVIANRIWQYHFGQGLASTPNDLGTHAEPPSHPELIDWLAQTIADNGWRLKPIHRLILLSSTYQQSVRSPHGAESGRDDPQNRLLWRFNRRRLSAEELRDAMLAVSGRLNLKMGGPSVMLPIDDELVNRLYKPSQWQAAADQAEHDRRSVYLIAKRNLRMPFMDVFDAPTLLTSCASRESSTHAPQALELLNGSWSNHLADAFAERLMRESGGSNEQAVRRAYQLALNRPPTPVELKRSLAFLSDGTLREFALAIFNLNEFVYVP